MNSAETTISIQEFITWMRIMLAPLECASRTILQEQQCQVSKFSTILGTCKGPNLGFPLAHQTWKIVLDLKLLCVAGPPVSKLWLLWLVDLILVTCAKFRKWSGVYASMRIGNTLPQAVSLKLQAPIQMITKGELSLKDITAWQLAHLLLDLDLRTYLLNPKFTPSDPPPIIQPTSRH